VVIESATPCGRCSNCRNTRQELCTDIQSFFYLGYFGFAEQTIVPAISALSCNGLSPDIASLSEPLGVAIDLVRLAEIQTTSNVLIMGLGPIGLMALALVKRAGARRVFVSDFYRRTARIKLAKRFGADGIIEPTATLPHEFDYGCEIDRILVTSPPSSLSKAFKVAVKGAIISFIGIGYEKEAFCSFDANEFHFKKLQLRASFASPALYTPLALQYLKEGVVDGEALISHRFPLEQINEAMSVAREDASAVKVMIEP
jgi:L-iditol 2-dehydrogenase